jgi:hypothetical protein
MLDCLLLVKVGINIADEASRHLFAHLLAIGDGRNENCQRSIWTLIRLTTGYGDSNENQYASVEL